MDWKRVLLPKRELVSSPINQERQFNFNLISVNLSGSVYYEENIMLHSAEGASYHLSNLDRCRVPINVPNNSS